MSIEHTPEDLTATVSAETTLAELQARLAKQGQWLPIDPPRPERLTIGALITCDESGPRRFGYGPIRDYLLGLRVMLADGREIKAGGKVVKNVAGYDLCKLFVGSRGSLGKIVAATFKLRPLPEAERFVERKCLSLDEAAEVTERILDSPLTPVVLDWHTLDPQAARLRSPIFLVLGFAGTREEVDWQLAEASKLGILTPSYLDYDARFWAMQDAGTAHKLSVLPSRTGDAVSQLGGAVFVARAGNGLVWYRGGAEPPKQDLPMKLMQRVKDAFDPNHILQEIPQ